MFESLHSLTGTSSDYLIKQQPTLPEGPSNPCRLLLATVFALTIESPQAQTEAHWFMREIVEIPLELSHFQLPQAVENRLHFLFWTVKSSVR